MEDDAAYYAAMQAALDAGAPLTAPSTTARAPAPPPPTGGVINNYYGTLSTTPGGAGGGQPPTPPAPVIAPLPPMTVTGWEAELAEAVNSAGIAVDAAIFEAALGTHLGVDFLDREALLEVRTKVNDGGTPRTITIARATGELRLDALQALTDELMAPHNPSNVAGKVAPARLTRSLRKLFDALAPEDALPATKPSPDPGLPPDRRTAPPTANDKDYDIEALVAEGGLLDKMKEKYQPHHPTARDLASTRQLKSLENDVVLHRQFPYSSNLAFSELAPLFGRGGVKKVRGRAAVIDEDGNVTTEEKAAPAAALATREDFVHRVHTMVGSICAVTFDKPNHDAVYGAALKVRVAVDSAEHLTSLSTLQACVVTAWDSARKRCNIDRTITLVEAFELVAAEIARHDSDRGMAKERASLEGAKGPKATPPGDGTSAEALTTATQPQPAASTSQSDAAGLFLKEMQEMRSAITAQIAAARAEDGKGNTSRREMRREGYRPVKLDDGTTKLFKRMPNGNEACPKKCTRNHGKGATCEMSHADK